MKLKDIIIPKKFTRTIPNPTKLAACEKYYKKYGELDKPITVDANSHLVDGYIRYLVVQKMGLTEVPIKLMAHEHIYVMAKHTDMGKEYWWKVKVKDEKEFTKRINIGDKVVVNTKKGNCPVTITHIVVRDIPPIDQRIKTVASF